MASTVDEDAYTRWFVTRGLPHLDEGYSVTEDVLTRTVPFLAAVVFVEMFATFGDRWTGWAQAAVFTAGAVAVIGAFAGVNRLRGRRPLALPDEVGIVEIAAFVVVPALVTAVAGSVSFGSGLLVVAGVNLVLVAGAYVVTSWSLLPMTRWALVQLVRQVGDVATLVAKSLPVLVVFSAFLFLNAEMWQVAADAPLPFYGLVVGSISAIGVAFLILSVRRLSIDLARFDDWDEIRRRVVGTPAAGDVGRVASGVPGAPPLGRRARFNVALLLFVGQGIQVAMVAVLVTVFYVGLGTVFVREATVLQWTTRDTLTRADDWAVRVPLFGDELLFTRELVLVAGFIGVVSGLQFVVQIVTDETYRREFAEDVTTEIRRALAVRVVRSALVGSTGGNDRGGHDGEAGGGSV